jgi:hypothetical protein
MAAIPRPNTLLDHQIIWWTPTIGDVSCLPLSGPVSGLWKLCQAKYNQLRTSVIFLTDRVTKHEQSTASERRISLLQPSVKWIEQVLDQLHSVHMPFRHIEFVVRDLQRMWLHVWGVLDYMEIFRPRMDGKAPPVEGVADTVGTITNSIRVAQDMFLAGLPCWLIRDSSTFCDQKIFRIAEIFHPKDYIVLGPHKFNYPIIYEGSGAGLEKYAVIERFARNFLRSRDPFAMTNTPSSLAGASHPSTPSTPAVASSSATQHSGAVRTQHSGAVRRPARGRGAGESKVFDIYKIYYLKL